MRDETTPQALQRKAAAGRPKADTAAMTPARGLRGALAKAAQQALGLDLAVDAVDEARVSLAELLDGLADRALLAVLEGPGEGLGLIAVSPPLLAAVIEVQTTGRVAPMGGAEAEPPRRPTRTDAAMTAAFLDALLTEWEAALAGMADLVWAGGFRYASFLDDPRPLGLMLEDAGFRLFRIALDLGPGIRQGEMTLALPATGRGATPAAAPPAADAQARAAAASLAAWDNALRKAVLGTPARVAAVLHRVTLPLSAVLGLQAGAVIPLPMAALDQLVLEGPGGRRLVQGRLGQSRGHRAVRLQLDADTLTEGPEADR